MIIDVHRAQFPDRLEKVSYFPGAFVSLCLAGASWPFEND